jgi:hypothetical protein
MSSSIDTFIDEASDIVDGYEDIGYDGMLPLIDDMEAYLETLPLELQGTYSECLKTFLEYLVDVCTDLEDE